jgi:hypothetical protein
MAVREVSDEKPDGLQNAAKKKGNTNTYEKHCAKPESKNEGSTYKATEAEF